ncbi:MULTISPECIES: hypothetical protein [unclassified Streptomyces]|uniref:hypothetical protein n=1 Tax=unclassified Streptomyces TaxID=2593676 RepID=UPI0036EBD9A2
MSQRIANSVQTHDSWQRSAHEDVLIAAYALVLTQSTIDAAYNTPRHEADWRTGMADHPALRAMRSAMEHFRAIATPRTGAPLPT